MKSDNHYSSSKAYIIPSWNIPREELWIISKTTKWDSRGEGWRRHSAPCLEVGYVSSRPGTGEERQPARSSPIPAPSPASFQVSRWKGRLREREGLSESLGAQLMASGSVSQGCPPKAAVGAQRLILEAVKIKEAERQEGS